jgi:hypothetical protein
VTGSAGQGVTCTPARLLDGRWLGLLLIVLLACSGSTSPAPTPSPEPTDAPGVRVLFVGNSYTFSHDLPAVLAQIAEAAYPTWPITTRMVAEPGWTLEQHWQDRRAILEIRGGAWDYVVLQGHSLSTLEARERLVEYARRFDAVIRDSGASTVLFMTWARRDQPDMLATISSAYLDLGHQLGARVAPVGTAWRIAHERRPDIHLWHVDGSHPSPAGTYLGAAVFYGLLSGGATPVGADHAGFGQLDREEIVDLQAIAHELTRVDRQ